MCEFDLEKFAGYYPSSRLHYRDWSGDETDFRTLVQQATR